MAGVARPLTRGGVGSLIIEFAKPKRFVDMRVKSLSGFGVMQPSAVHWDSLVPSTPTGQAFVPAGVTDWTDLTFSPPTASIQIGMFSDGYFDDLGYA